MKKRFASLWFRHLTADRLALQQPELHGVPFVLAAPMHGRMVITAVNTLAEEQGVAPGMVVADAKAFLPTLKVIEDQPQLAGKLLRAIGFWCIRYTPCVAVDPPDGLILDISGCAHLWGGERAYLKEVVTHLRRRGYDTQMAIAGTIGTAWAVARFGKATPIVETGNEREALMHLPPSALRLGPETVERLYKLGLNTVGGFIGMPHAALRKRFGEHLLSKLRQALGEEEEHLSPLRPVPPYEERQPSLEPIRTATGIEVAIGKLLEALCKRMAGEGKGLRKAILTCYRVDGKIVKVAIGTGRPTANTSHLLRLFGLKVPEIEPALGIELFVLKACKVEDVDTMQETLWKKAEGLGNTALVELLDRLESREGTCNIRRYLPDEHYWPERSIKIASSIGEKATASWPECRPRPIRLLDKPEPLEVTAPIPDYPPMLFRYKGETHVIRKADGPERIEREWWLEPGDHRDYYQVEDDEGQRYWLFRSGHYSDRNQWYIHGFFA
ncbi:Y-family DNA polymerase [Parapedobacter deserti]|uniref:Y-family DNA polymerase n=1 Tax=Parapedobacter deserti TaxID=1912957 RepID=A0ABV7JLC8_9SPHI